VTGLPTHGSAGRPRATTPDAATLGFVPTTSRLSRRLGARDLALVASFAALIAALGLPGSLYLFGGAVPITLQTLGIMLAASVLGARRGALAVLVLLVLVAAGLPLLSGGRGGLGVFAGPTAGYVIGFLPGALVTGWLVDRMLPRYPVWWGLAANVIGGIVVVYLIGVPVLQAVTGISWEKALVTGAVVFLPGDAVKAIVATVVAAGVHRGYPAVHEASERQLDDVRAG
jgi:biotin transport system substrate-specific component